MTTTHKSDFRAKKILSKDERFAREAAEHAASTQLLLPHSTGFLEPETSLERTYKLRQDQLAGMVDLQSKKKIFELKLPEADGPYRARYTRNGRHVLLGGERGAQLAGFDWQTGKLRFEVELEKGERVHDITWLQNETFFAAAQRKYVYIYDHAGREVHRMNQHTTAEHLAFLPYHFLLASAGRDGHLRYTDTSTGQMVGDLPFFTTGACTSGLAVNPRNAIINMGHANGTVTMWAPSMPATLVKLLAHQGPVSAVACDPAGELLATAGVDGSLRIWDLRTYRQPITALNAGARVSSMAYSQKGVLAVGHGPRVTMWRGLGTSDDVHVRSPYMTHLIPGSSVASVAFCPFEDVLGVGHATGFASLLVPGSGEANYDASEANPFANRKQRQEGEIKMLLDKLAPESIVMDPDMIGRVRRAAVDEIDEDRQVEAAANPPKKEKNRTRGKSSALKRYLRKHRNIVDERKHDAAAKEKIEIVRKNINELEGGEEKKSALSRFVRKHN